MDHGDRFRGLVWLPVELVLENGPAETSVISDILAKSSTP